MTDSLAFREAVEEYERSIPFSPEAMGDYRRLWKSMRDSAAPEHAGTGGEVSYFTDRVVCSCGWESERYWDGLDYAWDEWRRHVADELGLFPRKCACGKAYVPADGGRACHELVER